MPADDVIKLAIAAIGESETDDFISAPKKHADEISDSAPCLSETLKSSAVLTTAQ